MGRNERSIASIREPLSTAFVESLKWNYISEENITHRAPRKALNMNACQGNDNMDPEHSVKGVKKALKMGITSPVLTTIPVAPVASKRFLKKKHLELKYTRG